MEPSLLTSEVYWTSALVFALVDIVVVLFLAWRIRPKHFRWIKWTMVGSSAVLWGIFAAAVLWGFWDIYYRYFFPGWMRWFPPFMAMLYGAIGLALWWLALRLPGNPVLNFCLLGGLEAIPEHLWGIYGLRILERVPMLQGLSPTSVLVFAIPEYVLYWGVILGVATLFHGVWRWWITKR